MGTLHLVNNENLNPKTTVKKSKNLKYSPAENFYPDNYHDNLCLQCSAIHTAVEHNPVAQLQALVLSIQHIEPYYIAKAAAATTTSQRQQ